MIYPQPLGGKRSKGSSPHVASDRNAAILSCALLGFAMAVGIVITTRGEMGISALWFLAAATTAGSLTGLDLYLTRNWNRFGRLGWIGRFVVACTGAAGLTSALGVLLGLISPRLAWSFTVFGAIAGVLCGICAFGRSE